MLDNDLLLVAFLYIHMHMYLLGALCVFLLAKKKRDLHVCVKYMC